MTEELFREDATLATCEARVIAIDERGVQLSRTVFYPLGGGQAGDGGVLILPGGAELPIADTRKGFPTGRDCACTSPRTGSTGREPDSWSIGTGSPRRAAPAASHAFPHRQCRVRVLEIEGVDMQPCGGTHVRNTADIGAVFVSKIEKKSAMTRRVVLRFVEAGELAGLSRAQES